MGEPGKVDKFWGDMTAAAHPGLKGHPTLSRPNWRSWTVPVSFHGDGTPVAGVGKAWARMMDTFSWCSLLASGATLDFTMLIYSVFVNLLARHSMDHVCRIMCWSFEALAAGQWPERDAWGRSYTEHFPGSLNAARAGTQLAGGYCGVVWVIRGDLDYFANSLRLRHHHSLRPCSWCPCNSFPGDPMAWDEFRVEFAHWMQQLWDDIEWREAHPDRHPLFKVSGIGISTAYPDHTHSKSMGTDGYTYGSVLWLLVFHIMPG